MDKVFLVSPTQKASYIRLLELQMQLIQMGYARLVTGLVKNRLISFIQNRLLHVSFVTSDKGRSCRQTEAIKE